MHRTPEMSSLDCAKLDKILATWNWAKREEAAMNKKIQECKTHVDAAMMKAGITSFDTGKYKVEKRAQTREGVSKKDVPANVWSLFAKTSEYTVLSLAPLTGKRSATAKAKAKAKVSSKGSKSTTHGEQSTKK